MSKLYFLIVIFVFASIITVAQPAEKNEYSFKDGVYITYSDFKNNNPSIEISQLTKESRNDLEPRDNRMEIGQVNQLKYVDENGKLQKIKTKDIWGICVNNRPYIAKDMSVLPPRKIFFFKIINIGQLSRYFTIETNVPIGSFLESKADKSLSNNIPGRYLVKEFIIDFNTGEIHDLDKNFRKIKKLIKRDSYFRNVKIRKKNADVMISQFNERNPIKF